MLLINLLFSTRLIKYLFLCLKCIPGAIPSNSVVTSVMPTLDKDKITNPEKKPTASTPPPIFVIPPPPPPVPTPAPETPPATPTTSSGANSNTTEFSFNDPKNFDLLSETIKKLRAKEKEQEEKISKLREANDQHVDDKKKMKRELAEERSKVSKLLSRTISNAEKRKVCEDLLKPYMGDTAVKCFIDGKDGEFAKVGKWTRYVYKVEEYNKKSFQHLTACYVYFMRRF